MNTKVTLYIATHNKTGMKYFGKTTKYFSVDELQKYYHGSGTYWKNHLNKHGDDVTMEIYGIYDMSVVEEIALKFSKDNNIVKNYSKWANQQEENGIDGIISGYKMPPRTSAHLRKLSESKIGDKNPMKNPEVSKKVSNSLKGRPTWNKGKTGIYSDETIQKMSESKKGKEAWNKGKKEDRVKCPHCNKEGGKGAMKKYHFDNCKLYNNVK